jgi:hypothetical protein
MNIFVSKEIRLNIRIKPDIKAELQAVADFHGLTVSSYVHSVLIKKLREEKEREPQAFARIQSTSKLSASGDVKKGAPSFEIGKATETAEKKEAV